MSSPLITFDLGGVVVRVCSTMQEATERAGLTWKTPTLPKQPDLVENLLIDWQLGTLTDDAFFEAWAHALGQPFEPDQAPLVSEAWLLGEYEGMAPLAKRLLLQGTRLGCLSNTSNHHWNHMLEDRQKFPTIALLTERHASHLFGHMKPSSEIYKLFEQSVGKNGPDIVFFDDLQDNIQAASNRGWQAFHIAPDKPPAEQVALALEGIGIL